MVELRDRQVFSLPPFVAAVVGVPDAAVVARNQLIGVVRIDPEVVVIAVRPASNVAEALAAVVAGDQWAVGLVKLVLVLRVHDQVGEVERTPDHALAAVKRRPRLAAVVGAIKTVLRHFGFDYGVNDVRLGRGDRDCHTAPWLRGQSFGAIRVKLGPRGAAVGAFEKAAATRRAGAFAAGTEGPAFAAEIPYPGENRLRVLPVHRDHRTARRSVRALQNLRPCLAAVSGLVEAALVAVAPKLARRADVDHVRVARVYQNLCDAF